MKKNILILFAILLSNYSFSQITLSGVTSASAVSVSSLTFSKTVSAGSYRLLYVGVTIKDKNVTSVTWNGITLTRFSLINNNNMRVGFYYLALGTSPTPTTANVVVNIASSSDAYAGAADFTGVFQSTPIINPTTTQAKSATPSITFASAVGHLAVSVLGGAIATPTANGAGQTQLWSSVGAFFNHSTYASGAPSVVMSHTLTSSEDWVMIGGTMQDNATISLPIELLYFTGNLENNKVTLKWETATELNNDFFAIERSKDGLEFEQLSKIKSKSKDGNSTINLNYSYIDENPLDEESYYLLKQVDFSGKFTYSKIISVTFNKQYNISFLTFPNPNDGTFSVKLTGIENYHDVDITIYDKTGALVYFKKTDSYAIKDKSFNIQLENNVKSGIYTIVYSMEGLEYRSKMVVQ